ncbi:hypothetical protein AO381_1051 [Moraxella catarrhalis]|nr:hypothetical protein AO381_1051 [Moraxella catarrhalis]OAV06105.1 hypothetical protein AO379_1181 [Moraxella catarrhalis]
MNFISRQARVIYQKLCYNKGYFYQFIWSVRCQIRKKFPMY